MVTFCTYYIAWILGGEGRGENGDCSRSVVRTVSTGCETPQCAASWMLLLYAGDSSRWLLTPSPQFLSRGAQTFWHRARAYSTTTPNLAGFWPVHHFSYCFLCTPCTFLCTPPILSRGVRSWMTTQRVLTPLILTWLMFCPFTVSCVAT